MKKYFLCHLYDDYSGSPKVLSQCLNVLDECGVDNVVFIGSGSYGFISEQAYNIKRFFYRRSNYKVITLFLYLVSQLSLFFKLSFALIKEEKEKIVIVNTMLPFGASLAGKLFADSVILYSHEVSISPEILKKIILYIHSKTISKSFFVSQYTKNILDGYLGFKPGSIIYNALSEDYLKGHLLEESELHEKWNAKKIVLLSSLKSYKGIPEFINLSSSLEKFGCSFLLVINDAPENGDSFFSKFILPSNLYILYRPKNLIDIYREAFLVVNLSHKNEWVETFGLTLIEGMSQYNPVIAPVVGGPVEIVSNGLNGYLIDSSNELELISCTHRLSQEYEHWRALAVNARHRAEKFNFNEYKNRVISELGVFTS
ncbi:UNVERIFIED_CONTAM: glycosyltransferase [Aeromonas hydrophila]